MPTRIDPKTINTTTLTELRVLRSTDEPQYKRLTVTLRALPVPYTVAVTGEDYVTLGQWTDNSLEQFLMQKLELTLAQN